MRPRDHAGVHLRGTASWEVREDFDRGLLLALYVRDAEGLTPFVVSEPAVGEPEVGALDPAPDTTTAAPSSAAVREWGIWWHRALTEPPQVPPSPPDWNGLEHLPTVRVLAERHHRKFWGWIDDRTREQADSRRKGDPVDLTRWVNGYERRLGRPVRPFQLGVRLLPLAEPVGWVLAGDEVLVSTALRRDARAYEEFLTPVVDALA